MSTTAGVAGVDSRGQAERLEAESRARITWLFGDWAATRVVGDPRRIPVANSLFLQRLVSVPKRQCSAPHLRVYRPTRRKVWRITPRNSACHRWPVLPVAA